MAIRDLIKLLPPPKKPKRVGADKDWAAAEKELGTALPADWREFCEAYGSFGSLFPTGISIFNPFDKGHRDLIREKSEQFTQMKEEEDDSDLYPYEFFPTPGGVLPFGGTDQRTEFFYITRGKPDKWPIVIWTVEDEIWWDLKMTLTQFLTAIISGKAAPPFEKGWITKQGGPLKIADAEPAAPKAAAPSVNIYQIYVQNGNKADFWVTYPQHYDGVVYHIKKIGGKSSGPLRGKAPEFGRPPTDADGFVLADGASVGELNMEDLPSFPGFVRVDPPGWSK